VLNNKAPGPLSWRSGTGAGPTPKRSKEQALMPERIDPPADQPSPSLAPQPNQILAQPATVEACARDYAAGADVREVMAQQEARQR